MTETFSVKVREREGVLVLELTGDLLSAAAYEAVRGPVMKALEGGKNKIALHLAGVDNLDSGGLGVLNEAQLLAREQGGEVKLAAASARVRRLLALTHLDALFDMLASEDEALARFAKE